MNKFKTVLSSKIESLGANLYHFVHPASGAKHFHIEVEDDNNAFLVGFPTLPADSTGIAHILEHTALCGSKKYPVRDPFFMMLRRSLNTYMNAFTAPDATAYPFATRNKKDFYNLLSVYLDAVFNPNLNVLDFAQEGWRFELSIDKNNQPTLKYHGVVYGIKFILAFGSGPISVFLISEIYSITLEFTYLFLINAVMMALVSVFIIFLPIQNHKKPTIQD